VIRQLQASLYTILHHVDLALSWAKSEKHFAVHLAFAEKWQQLHLSVLSQSEMKIACLAIIGKEVCVPLRLSFVRSVLANPAVRSVDAVRACGI